MSRSAWEQTYKMQKNLLIEHHEKEPNRYQMHCEFLQLISTSSNYIYYILWNIISKAAEE